MEEKRDISQRRRSSRVATAVLFVLMHALLQKLLLFLLYHLTFFPGSECTNAHVHHVPPQDTFYIPVFGLGIDSFWEPSSKIPLISSGGWMLASAVWKLPFAFPQYETRLVDHKPPRHRVPDHRLHLQTTVDAVFESVQM